MYTKDELGWSEAVLLQALKTGHEGSKDRLPIKHISSATKFYLKTTTRFVQRFSLLYIQDGIFFPLTCQLLSKSFIFRTDIKHPPIPVKMNKWTSGHDMKKFSNLPISTNVTSLTKHTLRPLSPKTVSLTLRICPGPCGTLGPFWSAPKNGWVSTDSKFKSTFEVELTANLGGKLSLSWLCQDERCAFLTTEMAK